MTLISNQQTFARNEASECQQQTGLVGYRADGVKSIGGSTGDAIGDGAPSSTVGVADGQSVKNPIGGALTLFSLLSPGESAAGAHPHGPVKKGNAAQNAESICPFRPSFSKSMQEMGSRPTSVRMTSSLVIRRPLPLPQISQTGKGPPELGVSATVGAGVGSRVAAIVGCGVGVCAADGASERETVGSTDPVGVGAADSRTVGGSESITLGLCDASTDGPVDGPTDGAFVGAFEGETETEGGAEPTNVGVDDSIAVGTRVVGAIEGLMERLGATEPTRDGPVEGTADGDRVVGSTVGRVEVDGHAEPNSEGPAEG